MKGYQLTFYTEQARHHGHQPISEWLLHAASQLSIHGATVVNCTEGTGHTGVHHTAHGLRLTDQPVQVIFAVSEDEAEQLLHKVKDEHVHVFYTRYPIEYGVLGDDVDIHKKEHRFSLFGNTAQ